MQLSTHFLPPATAPQAGGIHDDGYHAANRERLVSCTWGAGGALTLWSTVLLAAVWYLDGPVGFTLVAPFYAGCFALWVLYQFGAYVAARYVLLAASWLGCGALNAVLGPEAQAPLVVIPLLFAALTLFPTALEKVGMSLASITAVSLGYLLHVGDSAAIAYVDEPAQYSLAVTIATAGVLFQLLHSFLALNREFRLRTRALTRHVEDRTARLEAQRARSQQQAAELARANAELSGHVARSVRLQRQLRSSNEQLEQFAYAASHDLKEPLRSISSFIQLIRRRLAGRDAAADADLQEYFGIVVDSAAKMTALLDDLLAYSRVGRVEAARERVDVAKAVQLVAYGLRDEIAATGAVVDVDDDLPAVYAGKRDVQAVLREVLSNAIRFHESGRPPRVRVSGEALADGAGAVLRVSDDGIGIEAEYRERVFQLFQRLNTSDRYAGSGVGLALARKTVRCYGGEMAVGANAPRGTIVTITFPLAGAAATDN